MTQLPDKLSDLLMLALVDLEKCENDPRYKIDMNTWHNPKKGVCHVCFAGSVMAQEFSFSSSEPLAPQSFTRENRKKFNALNEIRKGNLWGAFSYMDRPYPFNFINVEVLEQREEWKLQMINIYGLLAAHGE